MDKVWKGLEKQDREVTECSEQNLMGDSGWTSEDKNNDRNRDHKGQAQEVSVGNKDSADS